mgnify:CR=1 FL=1
MQQLPVLPSWKAFVDKDLCTGCGKCAKVCWTGAISIIDKIAVVDFNRCICCTACMKTCPRGALRLVPYFSHIVHRKADLDEMKAQLSDIGLQLEAMERSIDLL